ncbi:LADA_0B05710g1_1 [Lachancea dasiensis]|uniref:Decapping nuclease n=1 Tax=Lachancea dasiensis TaxID=1072105 RepID=A0A1G4ITK2_9SACH|nr:LADA_0B05710g1_1 [Lachancea dasiensis]
MRAKAKLFSLHSSPQLEATFRFIDQQEPCKYPLAAERCPEGKAYAPYNDIHEVFEEYLTENKSDSMPLLRASEESKGFTKLHSPPNVLHPRLLRLNLAMCEANAMDHTSDLLTNRGDLTDLALSFFPHFANGFEKIHHIAYVKHGRLFLWHDRHKDETFNSLRARNNWYSGYKFEAVCTHQWPADRTAWLPLPEMNGREAIPALSLVKLPLPLGVQAIILAEYDATKLSQKGKQHKFPFVELKCFQPHIPRINDIAWQKLPPDEALRSLVNKKSFMKFYKTCLQCKLAGCEEVVYGVRDSRVSLVGVRRFRVDEIERRLCELDPAMYHRYYLKALRNVAEFVRLLCAECREGDFYLVSKKSVRAPLSVQRIAESEVLFPIPFTPAFEAMLLEGEKERRDRVGESFGHGSERDFFEFVAPPPARNAKKTGRVPDTHLPAESETPATLSQELLDAMAKASIS